MPGPWRTFPFHNGYCGEPMRHKGVPDLVRLLNHNLTKHSLSYIAEKVKENFILS